LPKITSIATRKEKRASIMFAWLRSYVFYFQGIFGIDIIDIDEWFALSLIITMIHVVVLHTTI
jgi:hypothetical protein